MDAFELAKKVMTDIEGHSFRCLASASEGGRCGDGWCDDFDEYFSGDELRYMLKGRVAEGLFDGLSVKVINKEQYLDDIAEEMAFPDGRDGFEDWECGAWSEELEAFLDIVEDEITMVLNEEFTEEQVEKARAFYDDPDNWDEYGSVADWLEDQAESKE